MADNKDIIYVLKVSTQKDFAALIGVTDGAISDLIRRNVLQPGKPLGQWLKAYCSHIREFAAGRASTNGLDLASERALLAREQKLRIEMQNAITRREYGPIDALELGLSDVMSRVSAQLDTIPGKLKMSSDRLNGDDLDLVAGVIARIRNEMADSPIDWFGDPQKEKDDFDGHMEN